MDWINLKTLPNCQYRKTLIVRTQLQGFESHQQNSYLNGNQLLVGLSVHTTIYSI